MRARALMVAAWGVASAAAHAAPTSDLRFNAYIDAQGRLQLGDAPIVVQQHAIALPPVAGTNHVRLRPALQAQIQHAAMMHGVDPALLQAMVHVESAFDPTAVSSKGAVGLMQLMPATAHRFGVHDRYDVQQNLHGGAAYLAWLLRYFHNDLRLAVAAYNAGEGAVRRAGNKVPPWPETQVYVRRVLERHALTMRWCASEPDGPRIP